MGIVNDGNDHLAILIKFVSLMDEVFFAVEIAAFDCDLKDGAEDAQNAGIGVESTTNRGNVEPLGIVVHEGGFEGGFARAG